MELNLEEYTHLGAPVRFDVIDTSSILDYLGSLNLFVATAPLLTGAPSSVLYTETFPLFSSNPSTEFEATLFASLSIVAVLTDLAPVDVLSGFTTRCNTQELFITYLRSKDKDVHQQRFTWKRPSSCDPSVYHAGGLRPHATFDTGQLATSLHNIYLGLFGIEDPTHAPMLSRALEAPGGNDAAARALLQGLMVCPSREAFTAFLSFIRTFLHISEEQWSDIMHCFLAMRSENQQHFDRQRDSDLHAQLYRYRLHSVPGLDRICNHSATTESGRLSRWQSIPPLMRVFFTVPRAEFTKLGSAVAATEVPTNVWLRCALDMGPESDLHLFQSLDAAFGTLVDSGTAAAPDLSFRENSAGYKNGANAVFSFVVPSRVLTEPPVGTVIIRLLVRREPNTASLLVPVLGRALCVFSANLEDTHRVHLLPEPQLPLSSPSRPPSLTRPVRQDEVGDIGYQPPVHVELDRTCKQVASLTAKLEITNTTAQAAFAEGVMPDISQCSPCAIHVVLGGRTQTLVYPLPIVGSRRKLRLARKSSYVEVIVPVAIPFLQPDGLKMNQFPVVRTNGSLVAWNIHRVFLEQLPTLDIANIRTSQPDIWYSPHLTWQHSLRERTLMASNDFAHANSDPLVNVKWNIMTIMVQAAGLGDQGHPQRVFSLQHSVRKDTDTLLFVDKLRYDVAAQAIVCDAFVLAVSLEVLPHVQQALSFLVGQGVMPISVHGGHGVPDPNSEMCAWKRLLPALAERCRTTWTHGPNCEYAKPDGSIRVPRELTPIPGDQGDPLCSCGRGKDVEGMMKNPVWRMFAPYVTRIALSPLFGVPHIEQILEPSSVSGPAKGGVQPGPTTTPVSAGAPVGAMGSKTDTKPSDSHGLKVAESLASPAATCNKCKKQELGDVKLLKCSRCKTALYCSATCQKSDWKSHKLRCGNN